MRNVTVTLPEEVARWARIRAAEDNKSVSRFVGEILKARMDQESTYETAMHEYLGRQPVAMRDSAATYPGRDEIHDRPLLR